MQGILFKPDMIKAIVEGRKTQTRRVIKPQPISYDFLSSSPQPNPVPIKLDDKIWAWTYPDESHGGGIEFYPRYQVGETVYIKEAWWFRAGRPNSVIYRDGVQKFQTGEFNPNRKNVDGLKFKSPLFMKTDFARYFIKIKDVRAERLQEIKGNYQDCVDEGFSLETMANWDRAWFWYQDLWDTTNKPPYDWASNPYVFVYEFEFIPHQDKL